MREISVEEFKDTLHEEATNTEVDFINVCTTAEYNEKHIPGVRSVPLDALESRFEEFKGKKKIYIHCRSGNRSKRAIEELEKFGSKAELISMNGGIIAWEKAGFPTEAFTHRMPLMRQVLLTAGMFVVLGVTLSLFVNHGFIYISLFVGCGLMFAGLTGWCGLSYLLEKMPWNK